MTEIIGTIVLWLGGVLGSGLLMLGILYLSLIVWGRVLKYLGMWGDTYKIMVKYFKEKNAAKGDKPQ